MINRLNETHNIYLIKSSKYLFEENLFLKQMSQLVRPKMKTDSLMHIFSPICNRLIRRLAEKCGYKLFCQLHSQKETETFSSPIKKYDKCFYR